MTIYVDAPTTYPWVTLRYKTFSHMWSDESADELHAMAARLGLRRAWYQEKAGPLSPPKMKLFRNHYDVTPPKRTLALRYGAVAMEGRDFYEQRIAASPPPSPEPPTDA